MISFACPSCARTLKVEGSHAGKKARCPSCGHVIAVPLSPLATTPPTRSFTGPERTSVPAALASLRPEAATLPHAPGATPETPPPAPAAVDKGRTMPHQAKPEPDAFATTPPAAG